MSYQGADEHRSVTSHADPTRICFVYYSQPIETLDGVHRVTSILIRELSRRHIFCYVVYVFEIDPKYQNPNIIELMRLPYEKINHRRNVRVFADFVRDRRIDIVINQGGIFDEVSDLCIQAKRLCDFTLISVLHSAPQRNIEAVRSSMLALQSRNKHRFSCHPGRVRTAIEPHVRMFRKRILTRLHFRRLYKHSSILVLLSRGFIERFAQISGVADREKIRIINNPLSFEDVETGFDIDKKQNIFLYVGHLYDLKRVDRLLLAWKDVQDALDDWSLDIIGDGKDKEYLMRMAGDLRLKRVRFLGQQDPRPFYHRSKILCLTSTIEGWPMVLVEAQQMGVVPIAFESFDSVTEIITCGRNGMLVPPFDVPQFAATMTALARDDRKRERMARAAMADAQRYAPEKIAGQWQDLFFELLAAGRSQ